MECIFENIGDNLTHFADYQINSGDTIQIFLPGHLGDRFKYILDDAEFVHMQCVNRCVGVVLRLVCQ